MNLMRSSCPIFGKAVRRFPPLNAWGQEAGGRPALAMGPPQVDCRLLGHRRPKAVRKSRTVFDLGSLGHSLPPRANTSPCG